MAQISTFTMTAAGTAPTFGAAAAGDTALCGRGVFLVVRNSNAATRDVTIAAPGNVATGQAYPDTTITVAALTGENWIPLYAEYADPADGLAHLTYSATSGVTRAVVAV